MTSFRHLSFPHRVSAVSSSFMVVDLLGLREKSSGKRITGFASAGLAVTQVKLMKHNC